MSFIPHGDEEGDTRIQTPFRETEKCPANHQFAVILYKSHGYHDRRPSDHDYGEPNTWSKSSENDVARNFGQDIEWEKYGKRVVVLESSHAEIAFHAF